MNPHNIIGKWWAMLNGSRDGMLKWHRNAHGWTINAKRWFRNCRTGDRNLGNNHEAPDFAS